MDLFEYGAQAAMQSRTPLAERMRPVSFATFVGQEHLVGREKPLRRAIESDRLFSMILWGPPGCGKTTLARIIARETRSAFVHFSAVLSGIKALRTLIEEARAHRRYHHRQTILFVDEIHRFNKAQQDAFLPHVEDGLIVLIGATTENPSFEVIAPLLSRCRVFTLQPLTKDDIKRVVTTALNDAQQGLQSTGYTLSDRASSHLAQIAQGDARTALNHLEQVVAFANQENEAQIGGGQRQDKVIRASDLEKVLLKKALRYDKSGDDHYNLISAFHKSMRGGDPDAAIYWLERMLQAGEDPIYIARRMVRFASEDIGNADPRALRVALDATAAYRFLGSPEGDLSLVQSAVYLACAPKSNSLYMAEKRAKALIEKTGALDPPLHVCNAPTALMKALGYGKGYRYPHDASDGIVDQHYLPAECVAEQFYDPKPQGFERIIRKRLLNWQRKKRTLHQETKNQPKQEGAT